MTMALTNLRNIPITNPGGQLGSALGDLGQMAPLGLGSNLNGENDTNNERKRPAALMGDTSQRNGGAANDLGMTGPGRKLMPQMTIDLGGY
jgi:hypothetical protein